VKLRAITTGLILGGIALIAGPLRQAATGRILVMQSTGNGGRAANRPRQSFTYQFRDTYRQWLDEVAYIITPAEHRAFLQLRDNSEKELFIEQFWARRNPDPFSFENAYEREYYRRILFANDRFSTDKPGWQTDRGHVYVEWGPPDGIESGPTSELLANSGGENRAEIWKYRYLEGLGENIEMRFVGPDPAGDYRLNIGPDGSDAILLAPPSCCEQLNDGLTGVGVTPSPKLRFKDLEATITTRLKRDDVPLETEVDFFQATQLTDLVLLTLRFPNTTLESKAYNLFVRITTLSGRVVQTFEDTAPAGVPWQRTLPLMPALYRLDLAVKEVTTSKVTVHAERLGVPRFNPDSLQYSSLVLADAVVALRAPKMAFAPAAIGDYQISVQPVPQFAWARPIVFFWQVYGLHLDPATHKNRVLVMARLTQGENEIWRSMKNPDEIVQHGEQVSVAQELPPGMKPGAYHLRIQVRDEIANRSVSATANFVVR
jgi:GWxTD domain-containing protein